jgi:hypothetical protein
MLNTPCGDTTCASLAAGLDKMSTTPFIDDRDSENWHRRLEVQKMMMA